MQHAPLGIEKPLLRASAPAEELACLDNIALAGFMFVPFGFLVTFFMTKISAYEHNFISQLTSEETGLWLSSMVLCFIICVLTAIDVAKGAWVGEKVIWEGLSTTSLSVWKFFWPFTAPIEVHFFCCKKIKLISESLSCTQPLPHHMS